MKRSVSRIIDRNNEVLSAKVGTGRDSISIREIEMAFGKVPRGRYRVTYSLNKNGKYLMCEDDGGVPGLDHPGNHGNGLAVCFLPREWERMRVNRKVELLPKRRTK